MAVDETRELRQKSPVNYSENGRLIPFSEQLGTTSRGLQHAVNDVLENIHAIAPEASGKRYDELMAGLIHHPEFQMALQAQGMPSRADFLIAEGVVWQLGEIRQEGVARHYHGRGAANSIARAAACRVNELAEHGDRTSVAARLNYTTRQLRNIISRMEEQTIIDLLDPTRDERSDALSTEDLLLVEAAWEIFTDQDPTLTININAGDGNFIPKAVHHKKMSGEEIYEKANEFFMDSHSGLPCKLTKFKELKPPWIWEESFATCLCPYCYTMRLFMLGYVVLCRKAARPENTCMCGWCEQQKRNGRDGISPPGHAKVLAAKRYCEKKVAPIDSGFDGVYPTYAPACICKDLSTKRQHFFTEKFGAAACVPCEDCPTFNIFPAPTEVCSFMDDADGEVRYRQYGTVPDTSYTYMEYTSCNRREFAVRHLEHYSKWVSHRYHTDWQDAVSDMITG